MALAIVFSARIAAAQVELLGNITPEEILQNLPDWQAVVRHVGGRKAMLDLQDLLWRQAESAGVPEDRIRTVRVCTVCHPTLFYSYRREGTVLGTMVSGIMRVGR